MDLMPLTGELTPSTAGWARRQVELYEATDGAEGNGLRGRPIIVLTSIGARTGKLRKTALMRVEHCGLYAVVASMGGAPKHPVWFYNLKNNPHVELQDGPTKLDYQAREVSGDEKAPGGSGPSRPGPKTPSTRPGPTARSRSSASSR
jgi:F420H(2)-dependent quinone reductase